VNGKCEGYARYYSYNKKGYEGTAESRDRNYVVSNANDRTCPPKPAADVQEYTAQYPMANVAPGEEVTLVHPPRGHTSQNSSPVTISCKSDAGAEEILGTFSYNNCVGSDISWATCTGSVKIPSTWKSGSTKSCFWIWTLNGGQTYVDCFEYKVVGNTTDSSNTTAPVRRGRRPRRRIRHECLLDDE
jgi:hypothetical protein